MNAITDFISPIDAQNNDPQYRHDKISTVVSLLANPCVLDIIGYDQPVSQFFSLEVAITIAIRLEANQQIDPTSWQAMSDLVNLHFHQQRPKILESEQSSNKPYQNLLRFVAKQIIQDHWQQLTELSNLPNYSHYSDETTSFSPLWLDLIEMIGILKSQPLSTQQLTDLKNTIIVLTNCLIQYHL